MSPNGPYPGPPSQPWSGGGSDEPYTEPADPWGDQATSSGPAPWDEHPTSMPPGQDSSVGYPRSYGADPPGGAPSPWWPAAPPPRRNTPIVALVVVLGLLILGGLGTTAWLLVPKDSPASGTGRGAPTPSGPTTAANVAEPQPSEDARFVKRGQCVRNEGTEQNPAMTIVPCVSGTYQVLKRVDGRTTGEADAEVKCSKVQNYTKWYFYDSELDSLDFVLCLRER
jgi:hypothetical protein